MAPRGIQLCSLPLLPGRTWIRGGEGPGVLRALLRAVLRTHLRSMQLENSGSKLQKTEKSVFTNTMNISHCSSSLAEKKQSDDLMHCSECDHKLNNDALIQPVKQMQP